MRFTVAFVAGFAALASAATTTASVDAAQASQLACLDKCSASDVNCQAHCISVPSPNDAQANKTIECVGNCDQGSGSESDTQKYSNCVQSCIANNYWKTVDGTPQTTGSSGSSGSKSSASGSAAASATASGSGADSTGASKTESGSSSSGTATGSSSSPSSSGNAANALAVGSAGVLGLIVAVLAL